MCIDLQQQKSPFPHWKPKCAAKQYKKGTICSSLIAGSCCWSWIYNLPKKSRRSRWQNPHGNNPSSTWPPSTPSSTSSTPPSSTSSCSATRSSTSREAPFFLSGFAPMAPSRSCRFASSQLLPAPFLLLGFVGLDPESRVGGWFYKVADMHYANGVMTRCRDVLASEFRECSDLNTTSFVRRLIESEKPDFIAFTGTATVTSLSLFYLFLYLFPRFVFIMVKNRWREELL